MTRRYAWQCSLLALAALWALPAIAGVPIAGRSLDLRAPEGRPEARKLSFRSERSEAIAQPLPDPRTGAWLELFTTHEAGGCHARLPLAAAGWRPQGDAAAPRGWRFDDKAANDGVRKVRIQTGRRGGRIRIQGKGAGLPCALDREGQPVPFFVTLELGDERYCARFEDQEGTVKRNERGRFRARRAPLALACPDDDVRLANLNVLHGLSCPPGTDLCRLEDRIALLREWVVLRGCPAAIALQEVFDFPADSMVTRITDALDGACPDPYRPHHVRGNGIDDSLVLARHRALAVELRTLQSNFRNALHVRLDHPRAPIDLISTHLASGSDNGSQACGDAPSGCPPECVSAGAVTVRDCQAEQVALFLEEVAPGPEPAFVAGDMNAPPGSFIHGVFTGRGWIDTTLEAGPGECDPGSGERCTTGREDSDLTDLEATALGVDRRIDFVFLAPPGPGAICAGALDGPDDADGDGTGTRLFAEQPNPFSACGPAPAPICWVSDHSGVEVDLGCDPAS